MTNIDHCLCSRGLCGFDIPKYRGRSSLSPCVTNLPLDPCLGNNPGQGVGQASPAPFPQGIVSRTLQAPPTAHLHLLCEINIYLKTRGGRGGEAYVWWGQRESRSSGDVTRGSSQSTGRRSSGGGGEMWSPGQITCRSWQR